MRRLLLALALICSASFPLFAQTTTGLITTSGSTCATAGACVSLNLSPNRGSVGVSITGTFSATLNFEASANNGSTWVAIPASAVATGVAATTATAAGAWQIATGGLSGVRVRASALASGAATVVLTAGDAPPFVSASVSVTGGNAAASATGAAVPSSADYVGLNVGGTLTGATGSTLGSAIAQHIAIVDASGNQITAFGGGTTDTDDGSIAGGQSTGLSLGLNNMWSGAAWIRMSGSAADGLLVNLGANNDVTVTGVVSGTGTAGTPATGVMSVQGITSGTALGVTLTGTNNIATVTTVTSITNPVTVTGSVNVGTVSTVSGSVTVISGTATNLKAEVIGTKTTNVASPGANNFGVLAVVANASEPSFTEGNLVTLSSTLDGGLRNVIKDGAGNDRYANVTAGNALSISVDAITAAATGPTSAAAADSVVLAYPVLIRGAVTSAMTGTTSTEVIAGTASNYQYITNCVTSNSSLTVSTDIVLQDGSGGATLYNLPAPAASVATTGGGGGTYSFPTPLQVPTSGNGLFAANVTTGSSTKISCSGFRSTIDYVP